jgi:dethiobiotin synthetase
LTPTGPLEGRTARGIFVTGTDTGVGKTVVAALVARLLATEGERVAVFKPAVTGLAEAAEPVPDHELLRAASSSTQEPAAIAPYRFYPPLSPHLAAEMAGEAIDPGELRRAVLRAAIGSDVIVVEGVGGLLVPLTDRYLVRDFACELGLPVVIAARPALGTINHSLLTIEAARTAGLAVAGVVLTPWPAEPGALERSNRETIARLGGVSVSTLAEFDVASLTRPPALDEVRLPFEEWLGASSALPTWPGTTIAQRDRTAA